MNLSRLISAVAAGLVVLAIAAPATAAPASTPATVTVTGGVLSIAVSTDPVTLGSRSAADGEGSVSGLLGQVTVTDKRGGSGEWTASVVATRFTSRASTTLRDAVVGYRPGKITTTGTVTVEAHHPSDLAPGAAAAVVAGTDVDGVNTATWNPTVTVDIPAGVAPSAYTATFTHSVA